MIFNNVRKLEEITIQERERWIYIADFNIAHEGNTIINPNRIDVELEDLKQLCEFGGRIAILAHKGRFKDNDTEPLDFVVGYLSKKLDTTVTYFPENNTLEAINYTKDLDIGEIAIMGNTRFHEGEEKNDSKLAKQFAKLGDRVAVGGFGKAHREHASNVGILNYIPGYATRSQLKEMRVLTPWAELQENRYSLAVLGGVKKEKITIGLTGFSQTYDSIIPGGIVLNTLLKVHGYPIGNSIIKDGGKSFEIDVIKTLEQTTAKIYIPQTVVIAQLKEGI